MIIECASIYIDGAAHGCMGAAYIPNDVVFLSNLNLTCFYDLVSSIWYSTQRRVVTCPISSQTGNGT